MISFEKKGSTVKEAWKTIDPYIALKSDRIVSAELRDCGSLLEDFKCPFLTPSKIPEQTAFAVI